MSPRSMDEILQDDIDQLKNSNNPRPLIEKFENGFPLHEYQPTRDLIVGLLNEASKSLRGNKLVMRMHDPVLVDIDGRAELVTEINNRAVTPGEGDQIKYAMLSLIAQANGTGIPIGGDSYSKPTTHAIDLVCHLYSDTWQINSSSFKRDYWAPYAKTNERWFNHKIGQDFPDMIRNHLEVLIGENRSVQSLTNELEKLLAKIGV